MHSLILSKELNGSNYIIDLLLGALNESNYSSNMLRSNDNHCFMIGLPSEMNIDEFKSFIEPFLCDMTELIWLNQSSSLYIHSVELQSSCALLRFIDYDTCVNFSSIYNNLHFPSDRTVPPCLLLIPSQVYFAQDVDTDTKTNNSVSITRRKLPLCCVCLRRIKASVSNVIGSNDIPVSPRYYGNGFRCSICRIYGGEDSVATDTIPQVLTTLTSSSSSSSSSLAPPRVRYDIDVVKLRSCITCNLYENIWVCMNCGHTGCGRYTCQHAKNHYDLTGHPFSLELASGRIWDYDFDTFAHLELPSHGKFPP